MMRRLLVALLLMFACCAQRAAAALSCSLATQPVNFGTYTGSNISTSTVWKVSCNSNNDAWNIEIFAGSGAGANETTRYMTLNGGTAKLAYLLFQDSAHTQTWGSTNTTDKNGTGPQSVTLYAELTGAQIVPPGTYTDTVTTATQSFTVTTTIVANCSVSAANLSFGNYSGTAIQSNSTITVNCTNLTPFNIGLSAGSATGATVTTRKMTGPGAPRLNYSLFRKNDYATNWGNTVGIDTLAATATGINQSFTVYGQLPGAQSVPSGAYLDTIVATVTY